MRLIVLLIPFLILSACGSEKETKKVKSEKSASISKALNKEDMYVPDSVTAALSRAGANQKAESRRLFLQGLDLLANKNNAPASIEFFMESILYYPDEKNYIFLFKAYIETENIAETEKVNNLLRAIPFHEGGIQYYEVIFNDALIYAVKKDTAACIESLAAATLEGFLFKDRLLGEKRFEFLKDKQSFQSLIVTTFGDEAKMKEMLFNAFIKSFPDLQLPLEINADSSRAFNFDNYINYDFSAFIPGMDEGRFSRDVSNEYMYVGKLKLERGYAFVYKSFMTIADTLNPVKTFVVTYDTLGNVVENEMIGCYCSPMNSSGFTVNKDLSITTISYKTTWEKDPLENGYAGNKIVVTEEETKSQISINPNGTLKREEVAKTNSAKETAGG